jgi:hypothetical protein
MTSFQSDLSVFPSPVPRRAGVWRKRPSYRDRGSTDCVALLVQRLVETGHQGMQAGPMPPCRSKGKIDLSRPPSDKDLRAAGRSPRWQTDGGI